MSHDQFDVLLIDAFDEGGHLGQFSTRRFYQRCHQALTAKGIVVLNFSGDAWRAAVPSLGDVFRDRVVWYCCPDGDNVIAFASKGDLPSWTRQLPAS